MSNPQIQKVKVKRLAQVGLWATDVTAQAKFYHHVLGLGVCTTPDNTLDQGSEMEDANILLMLGSSHPDLALFNDTRPATTNGRKPATRSQLHHLSFEVDTEAELAALAARLKMADVDLALSNRNGDEGTMLWFADPDGNRIEISVTPDDFFAPSSSTVRGERSSMRPTALQHVALNTTHLETMVEFYTEALGFDISDWLLRESAWLRCNTNHHTLMFTQGRTDIDHIGYNIISSSELLRWADYLSNHQVPLLWGPGRHGAGNDLFLRIADPEGVHIELSTELQQYYDLDVSAPPRLWHTRATALNLWGMLPAWIREEAQV